MSSSIDGLVSGLNTTELVEQLISLERAPQNRLLVQRDKANKIVAAFQGLNTKLVSARMAGQTLANPTFWQSMRATTGKPDVATASATSSALPGTLSFSVSNLATSGSMASSGTVGSTASIVAPGPVVVAAGGRPLGIAGLKADAGLTVGAHTVKVTQSSSAATKVGAAPLAGSTTVDGLTIELSLDGVGQAPVVLSGTNLTASQVVAELQAQLGSSFAVGLDQTGALRIATVDEGSAASIQVTGGTALGVLNLAVDGAAIQGGDGLLDVGGVVTAVTDASAGTTLDLGTMVATLAGGVRTGVVDAKAVDHGDGTLSQVVSAINGAKAGVSAAAVQVSPGQFRLQLTATSTGSAGDPTIAVDAFGALGTLVTNSVAQDAELVIGTGPGAYTVTSSSNSVTSLLPGVTLNLTGAGATTVQVSQDSEAVANAVDQFVTAVNTGISEIKALTAFDAEEGIAGLLLGNFTVRNLSSKLSTAIIDPVITSALKSGGLAGVSVTKTGSLTFDKTKFLAALADDPDAVAKLFVRGGSATSNRISLANATDRTQEGTYDIVVTTAAEQAERVGNAVPGGTVTAAETIDVRVGGASGKTVTYAASAGESLTSIAQNLNTLLAEQSFGVSATVEGGTIVLRTAGYGALEKFEVRSTAAAADQTGLAAAAGVWEEHVGVNVAGTIGGVAATGSGQLLQANGDEPLASLRLLVTATPPEVAMDTNFGTFTYVRGIGQRIASTVSDASDVVSGSITAAIEGRQSEIARLDAAILDWENRLEQRELFLRRKFTAMETALAAAKAQSEWLAGQVVGLNSVNYSGRK